MGYGEWASTMKNPNNAQTPIISAIKVTVVPYLDSMSPKTIAPSPMVASNTPGRSSLLQACLFLLSDTRSKVIIRTAAARGMFRKKNPAP